MKPAEDPRISRGEARCEKSGGYIHEREIIDVSAKFKWPVSTTETNQDGAEK